MVDDETTSKSQYTATRRKAQGACQKNASKVECCLAEKLGRSWQVSRLQFDEIVAKQKSFQDETKLKADLNASLELQCRETTEQNTGQASRQASRQWKLKQNNETKDETFFVLKNVKKQARKKGFLAAAFSIGTT